MSAKIVGDIGGETLEIDGIRIRLWGIDAPEMIPIIYFLGTSPGRYQPIIPTFIVGWRPEHLRVQLAFGAVVGASAEAVPPGAAERRYALREVKARLHQASFRDAVLAAYDGRCAISHLPEPRLLDAAHIVVDQHEQTGPADHLEWAAAHQAPSCRLRRQPDRHRP